MKIVASTAEVRAILVHSDVWRSKQAYLLGMQASSKLNQRQGIAHSAGVATTICLVPIALANHALPSFSRALLGARRAHRAQATQQQGQASPCSVPAKKCPLLSVCLQKIREQKRHIKLWHIKLCPVTSVTGPPGRVSGQKDLCSLGSEDST